MWGVISYSVIVESIITERVHVAENREVVTEELENENLESLVFSPILYNVLHTTSRTTMLTEKNQSVATQLGI